MECYDIEERFPLHDIKQCECNIAAHQSGDVYSREGVALTQRAVAEYFAAAPRSTITALARHIVPPVAIICALVDAERLDTLKWAADALPQLDTLEWVAVLKTACYMRDGVGRIHFDIVRWMHSRGVMPRRWLEYAWVIYREARDHMCDARAELAEISDWLLREAARGGVATSHDEFNLITMHEWSSGDWSEIPQARDAVEIQAETAAKQARMDRDVTQNEITWHERLATQTGTSSDLAAKMVTLQACKSRVATTTQALAAVRAQRRRREAALAQFTPYPKAPY